MVWEIVVYTISAAQKRTRHCETSPQTGRGNPLVLPVFFVANRYILPFNGGIATGLRPLQ